MARPTLFTVPLYPKSYAAKGYRDGILGISQAVVVPSQTAQVQLPKIELTANENEVECRRYVCGGQ